ncbi:MAG: glycosyltransferase family 4 protein [Chloroflexi bacterium]|nr:glycosyltransferase family 4 protein [Chloroflexota bacterium]
MDSLAPARKGLRVGFLSTRFIGTDGVSLETGKWAEALERLGHTCFYFAGASDRENGRSRVVPEALFTHPDIKAIYTTAFSQRTRPRATTDLIHQLKEHLKAEIYAFVRDWDLDLLIPENALAIPMNIPLGLALTEFIAETGMPTIAHHHDFFWERKRFLVNCAWDYLNMAFPPHLPSIHHVVINSSAANQLSLRTGISSLLIPNVMDFDHPPVASDDYARDARETLGVAADELFFLQPTRVVQRKGIEHAMELINHLGLKARLVISHASGDEGDAYERRLRDLAVELRVPTSFVSEHISDSRGRTADGHKIYTLADVYPLADLVTYPSDVEGFGNAFLEAIYYRRPIVVNNYSIFDIDIKPKGFRVVEFDGFISDDTVRHVREVLGNRQLAQDMVEYNYRLGKLHYSYTVLERRLQMLLTACFGERPAPPTL